MLKENHLKILRYPCEILLYQRSGYLAMSSPLRLTLPSVLPRPGWRRSDCTGPVWLSEWPATRWNPGGPYSEGGGRWTALLLASQKPEASTTSSCSSKKTAEGNTQRSVNHAQSYRWHSVSGAVVTCLCNTFFLCSRRCMSRTHSSLVQEHKWWWVLRASVGLTYKSTPFI